MPTENSAPDCDHTLFGVFQLDGVNFLKNVRLGAQVMVQKMKTFLRVYDGVHTRITRHASEIGTLARLRRKPAALGSQPVNNQQIAITSPEPVLLPFHSHNDPSHSEMIRMEEGRQASASGQHSFNKAPSTHSKRGKMWMALLILGILFLIIVPGLLIGIITKEIPVGIALSGAIATVTSLFAGIYYYHNK